MGRLSRYTHCRPGKAVTSLQSAPFPVHLYLYQESLGQRAPNQKTSMTRTLIPQIYSQNPAEYFPLSMLRSTHATVYSVRTPEKSDHR